MRQLPFDLVASPRSLCLLSLVLLFGCTRGGDLPTAPVSGKVTYKGKPVPSGTVMFVPEKGPPATGEIGKDGSYSLGTYGKNDGAVLGKHKIAVTAVADMSDRLPEDRNPLPPPIVPSKYLSQDTSELTFEVKQGKNVADLDLKD